MRGKERRDYWNSIKGKKKTAGRGGGVSSTWVWLNNEAEKKHVMKMNDEKSSESV